MSHFEIIKKYKNIRLIIIFIIFVIVLVPVWYIYYSDPYMPLVDVYELRKELVVDKQEYHVNETIKATIILYNDNDYPVRLKKIFGYGVSGYSNLTEKKPAAWVFVSPGNKNILIEKKTYIEYVTKIFYPEYVGEYIIIIMGEKIIVKVID